MACALRLVGKAAMGHAQQRAAVALDQIDLDQARSRRHLLAPLPTEGVDETVDRHDLSERAARNPGMVGADPFEEVKPARMCFGRRLAAHPADDLFRVGQEGENRSRRGGDLGLASDDERFIHRCLLRRAGSFAGWSARWLPDVAISRRSRVAPSWPGIARQKTRVKRAYA